MGLQFFGHAVLGVQNLYFSGVFGPFVLKIYVSPRSLGGGAPPDAQDLHPQHDQDCLVAMNVYFFADTSGVLFFQAMLELAC